MNTMKNIRQETNKNVMEELVLEEINKQISQRILPKKNSINKLEVATYALNLLPPLYASSAEGLRRQKNRGRQKFKQEIYMAVCKGFTAVEKEPNRISTPLRPVRENELEDLKIALKELSEMLPNNYEELSWQDLINYVKDLVYQQQIEELSTKLSNWHNIR